MVALAGFGYVIISDFERLIVEMGGPIPFLTNLYLSSYRYWGVLALFPLFVLILSMTPSNFTRTRYRVTMYMLIAHIVIGFVIFMGVLFAMYAPIFELGKAQ